jgi:hypothetical protein
MEKRKGFTLTSKGYWRHTAGKYRNQYEHRVIAAKKLGRPLRKDEDVHHKDGNKQNNKWRNLQLLSHAEHGFYSAPSTLLCGYYHFSKRTKALERFL